MNLELITLIVLSFAAYRITRILVIDTLFEGIRGRFHSFLASSTGKLHFLSHKLLELTSCTFCAGAWVSLAVYSFWINTCPIAFTKQEWIIAFAVMGGQSFLHVLEPDE